MFETCIQMIFKTQSQNNLKMSVIDMRINSEKPFEYGFYH